MDGRTDRLVGARDETDRGVLAVAAPRPEASVGGFALHCQAGTACAGAAVPHVRSAGRGGPRLRRTPGHAPSLFDLILKYATP